MRHLLNPLDFSVEETNELLTLASDIEHNLKKYAHVCDGKKLATLFYEPSTRTRLSFESAMLSLGGSVLGFSSANSSSAAKGESVADTIRMISCYADIAAMRHPKEGSALVASMHSQIPVINAGDGGHQHLRRLKVRTYRSFPDQRYGPLPECPFRTHFPGRVKGSGIHP